MAYIAMGEPEQRALVDIEKVGKLWGYEKWIVNDPEANYCGKLLRLKPGYQSSLHYHEEKDETFLCVEGLVWVEYFPEGPAMPGETTLLRSWAGDSIRFRPGIPHRFWTESPRAVIVEFSTAHSDEDVVRLEESKKIE